MTVTTPATGLPPALSRALEAKGYDVLTEVQQAMLEPGLEGRDLLVSARTGSGKTVAFGLAVADDLLAGEERLPGPGLPLGLVVAPTRELAMQVAAELDWLYREAGVAVATCVGGMEMGGERRALRRGAHIVVGTPGRLVDHISRGSLDLSALRAVVLDEADEMLNLGFREELEAILTACPAERRTLMFSATVGGGIANLAARYQKDAMTITAAGPARQHEDIAYHALLTAQHDAERAIVNTLRLHEAFNAIVFCSTRAAVARLSQHLAGKGFSTVSLSGELSQKDRSSALQAMRDGRARVCVATDVAARGIDLPGLDLVIHADLPKNKEALLHRSGRTGRAGRKGTCVLVVPPAARRRTERLLKDARVGAEWGTPPSREEIEAKDAERLLADPILTEAADASELTKTIAETYSAEHLAAALVRLHLSTRSKPETLSEIRIEDGPRPKKPRLEIKDGQWVVLSVGRTKRAEARWLLPMLCKSGSLDKSAIGAIRVREDETYVQIDGASASGFLERIAQKGGLEDGIAVRRADGPPPHETAPRPAGIGKAKRHQTRQPSADAGEPEAVAAPWAAADEKRPAGKKPKADASRPHRKAPSSGAKHASKADGHRPRQRQNAAKPFKRIKKAAN